MKSTETRMDTVEAEEEHLPPKPQRIRPLPKIKGVEMVNVAVEALPESQDKRDRDKRALKALKITKGAVTRRSSDSEEETGKTNKREPEDSGRKART